MKFVVHRFCILRESKRIVNSIESKMRLHIETFELKVLRNGNDCNAEILESIALLRKNVFENRE